MTTAFSANFDRVESLCRGHVELAIGRPKVGPVGFARRGDMWLWALAPGSLIGIVNVSRVDCPYLPINKTFASVG